VEVRSLKTGTSDKITQIMTEQKAGFEPSPENFNKLVDKMTDKKKEDQPKEKNVAIQVVNAAPFGYPNKIAIDFGGAELERLIIDQKAAKALGGALLAFSKMKF